ncbi:hypothetical protein TraAM80_04379 [Trypanosoma rangeli]|uniref:Uncharacterized protein n=1 Tax=Trypanosoma rangeli TaxID=5698 RepID=A0A3R7KG12_TRYRA|nr:uncharacterized protein TraAM80_04379 [Trypanosoma rangeli]RNF05755.1 hypothetical protein TraAM80_04379 [Trypanosoma rangeli]|eukprot:RNF05755.1 hypothetical protein TraAM80_04379 [Trypanosoma rangeli]
MRLLPSTACARSGARQLSLPLLPSCRRCYMQGGAASSARENSHRQQGFYSLGEYLQRLPRGIRDLLLWSPAIAAAYFILYKQAVYFLPSVRQRLLIRPLTTAPTPGGSGTDPVHRSGGVQVYRDDASGAVANGQLITLVDNGQLAAVPAPPPPIPPFSTGTGMDAKPLQVVRDAETGKVSGYTAVG